MTIFVRFNRIGPQTQRGTGIAKFDRRKESTMTNFLRNLWTDDQGQDLIEYTLLMAFVALGSAALFISAGTSVSSIWSATNSQLSAAATAAAS
jgi:Flp pilus assembly pilin Flp